MTNQLTKVPLLTLYKASAGSGKTFMLTVRYISLLVQYPESYRNILAVTFTNKATVEMKQRILSQLYGISHSLVESDVYLQEIKKIISTHMSDEELRCNAGKALNSLLQDYSHFRVETIDSFFQSVLRNLAKELQLGANQSLELDTGTVINEAVDSFLNNLQANSKEMKLVISFIDENIQNNDNWNIDTDLKTFARQLFNEVFLEKGESLKPFLEDPERIIKYKKNLEDRLDKCYKIAIDKLKDIDNDMRNGLEAHNMDNSNMDRFALSAIRSIGDDSFLEKINNKRYKTIDRCIEDPSNFLNAKGKKDTSLLTFATRFLSPKLEEARDVSVEYLNEENSTNASIGYLNRLSLLLDIRNEINSQNASQGRFVLADTSSFLSRMEDGDTSFVFERTGNFTRHIMIDEFQDTSRLQWQNLRILMLECLAQGQESLVVGDVKQSIYRWRNSDWNILNTGIESDMKDFSPTVISLSTNRRSCPNIIDFNNSFFPIAADFLSIKCQNAINDPFPAIKTAYNDVCQECPSNIKDGYVKILYKEKKKDDDSYVLPQLIEEIKNLITNGVRQSDITILTRRKADIEEIAGFCSKKYPELKMVSSEAFSLEASVSVRILIDALSYLADNSDQVAKAELSRLWNHEEGAATDGQLPAEFTECTDSLRQTPLYELVERLYNIFRLENIEGQDDYVFAFLDAVKEYLKKNANNIADFISFWDDKLHNSTVPSVSVDGIRLMTIHKSKGLEFHTVILPFCHWNLTSSNLQDNGIWVEPSVAPYNEIPLLPIKFNTKLTDSVYKADYANEYGQLMVDNLNLLYVAFTRTKCNLLVLSEPTNKDSSISSVIRQYLDTVVTVNDENDITAYEMGATVPHINKETKATDNPFEIQSRPIFVKMHNFGIKANFKQSNQSMQFVHSIDEDDVNDASEKRQTEYIETGKMLHQLLSTIRTVDDINRETDKLLMQGMISDSSQASKIKKLLCSATAIPPADDWFSGRYRLYNETAILFRNGNTTCTRRPDRVMTDGEKTIIVDFKFGREKEDYHHQVQEYTDLLKRMGRTNIKGYIWYVYDNNIIEC